MVLPDLSFWNVSEQLQTLRVSESILVLHLLADKNLLDGHLDLLAVDGVGNV